MHNMPNHKYWEMNSLPYRAYKMVLDSWDDDRRLRYEQERLQDAQFTHAFLTADEGRIVRLLGLEDRHVEYAKNRVESCENFVTYDDQYRKSRAWAKAKDAEEQAAFLAQGTQLGPHPITLGRDLREEIIFGLKNN